MSKLTERRRELPLLQFQEPVLQSSARPCWKKQRRSTEMQKSFSPVNVRQDAIVKRNHPRQHVQRGVRNMWFHHTFGLRWEQINQIVRALVLIRPTIRQKLLWPCAVTVPIFQVRSAHPKATSQICTTSSTRLVALGALSTQMFHVRAVGANNKNMKVQLGNMMTRTQINTGIHCYAICPLFETCRGTPLVGF